MDNRTIAFLGACLLFLGVFMPIVSLPFLGSVNYFANGKGDGVLVLFLAAFAAWLALSGRVKQVVWPGAAALAVMAFTFFRFQQKLSEMRDKMDSGTGDNPLRGLAEAAVGAIQIQWGWAVLVLGAGLLVWAGIAERRLKPDPEPGRQPEHGEVEQKGEGAGEA